MTKYCFASDGYEIQPSLLLNAYLEKTEATTLVAKPEKPPVLALKNNLLYDTILLPNIELELYIARRLPIKSTFGIEFNLGLGFLYTKYEKYTRNEQMYNHYVFYGKDKLKYFGPTKAKISLVWRLADKTKKGAGK